MSLDTITAACAAHGLRSVGVARDGTGSVVLLGPDNPRFWPIFAASQEARDGKAHPLDRWSTRVIGALAGALDCKAAFPFGGPPYAPFLRWAQATGHIGSSPIGPFVDADMGLWVSFRGALIWPSPLPDRAAPLPCTGCAQPCATACPVDAFAGGTYDAARCRAHISAPEGAECLSQGCKARHACPVGQAYAPPPAQARLHMTAFRDA